MKYVTLGKTGLKISRLGFGGIPIQRVYAELKDLPVTLWIDDTGYVVQYELDITEMMQKIMDVSLETMGAETAHFL